MRVPIWSPLDSVTERFGYVIENIHQIRNSEEFCYKYLTTLYRPQESCLSLFGVLTTLYSLRSTFYMGLYSPIVPMESSLKKSMNPVLSCKNTTST